MKSRSFRVAVAIVGITAVIAIVGIVVGVLTHHERTLLLACWGNNTANYVEKGTRPNCDQPEEVIWPSKQIPITVTVLGMDGSETADPAFAKSMAAEVRSLDAELGMGLFSMVQSAGYVSAREVPYERSMGDERGIVVHHRDSQGQIFVDMRIVSGLDMSTFHEVVRHELLHAAGLAHDDYEESVMFPITPDYIFSTGISKRRISDADLNRLRKLYN